MSAPRDVRSVRASMPPATEPRHSGIAPRDTSRRERDSETSFVPRTSEASFVPRTSVRVPRGTAHGHYVEPAAASTPRYSEPVPKGSVSHESEFFWDSDAHAAPVHEPEWDEPDATALALQQRQAVVQHRRRQKYQQRVLYAVTAAACFTALGLTVELQRQKGREVEIATAARALSMSETAVGNGLTPSQPAVAEPPRGLENAAPPPAPVAVEVVEALEVVGADNEVVNEQASAPGPSPIPAVKVSPATNSGQATPRPATPAAQVLALAAAKPATAPRTGLSGVSAPRPSVAAAAGRAAPERRALLSFDTDRADVSAPVVTREVRPSKPSEKPPTLSFPSVN